MNIAVISELDLHATEELTHAQLLVTRIIQLGGTPVLNPENWFKLTNCGYDAPEDPYVEEVLNQNIKGEQCAIRTYSKLMDLTKEADPVTHDIILQIITDEVEHEEDLSHSKEDLDLMLLRRK